MSLSTARTSIEVHLGPQEWDRSLRREALVGLTASPKELSPTWLYDERGCRLFDEITRLPEYYPTRAERSILHRRALEIAAVARADTLVELGAGTADKTRVLLDAMSVSGLLQRYVPFDVAEETLRSTAASVAAEHPDLRVEGVVGDFRRHLGHLPTGGRRLIAFLGGTIGNLVPKERSTMLATLADGMERGDTLLLGTDLVKDRTRLVAAYDDAAGVTAAFNKNVLAVLNRELGADFDLDRFDHVARFDEDHEWIEMRLRSRGAQTVHVPELELTLQFADGEDLRTEISAKFRPERVRDELDAVGLELCEWWTDDDGDFALSLAIR
ncbi:MAG TPA: L-histidine N(alpha)-methyltransferase [Acidimicrobiales bacterium]|nr:L-histidine N(alpha)-methyltransferase [Acidimicrobiales bacterium]